MSWLDTNLAESLVVIGLLILAIEILILGFSTFVLFFVGCAMVLTGVWMFFGFLPETMLTAVLSTGLLTAIGALFLWKPLKRMQKDVDNTPAKSDLIGHSFTLPADVSSTESPEYHYSGIQWKLKSDMPLAKGTKVKVTKTEVGTFFVESADKP